MMGLWFRLFPYFKIHLFGPSMRSKHNENEGVFDNDDVGYGVDDSAAQLDVGKLPEGGAR